MSYPVGSGHLHVQTETYRVWGSHAIMVRMEERTC